MAKVKMIHCNIRHTDAYLIEHEDGKIVIRCPQRPYCSECPFEKGVVPKRQRI
jgi:positive regulator of sigma E activity